MSFHNPDPKKFVIKIRKGKPILVDKQIIRWRAARKKAAVKLEPTPDPVLNPFHNAPEPDMSHDQSDLRATLRRSIF
jgi:hypothetical protein